MINRPAYLDPERSIEPPEDHRIVTGECCSCGAEIFEDETYYDLSYLLGRALWGVRYRIAYDMLPKEMKICKDCMERAAQAYGGD